MAKVCKSQDLLNRIANYLSHTVHLLCVGMDKITCKIDEDFIFTVHLWLLKPSLLHIYFVLKRVIGIFRNATLFGIEKKRRHRLYYPQGSGLLNSPCRSPSTAYEM